MLRAAILGCVLAGLPWMSHASAQISLASSDCTGPWSLTAGPVVSLACTGNLTLDGGWIEAEEQISLYASGDLTLDHLILRAPYITLSSLNGTMNLGREVTFTTPIPSVTPPTPGLNFPQPPDRPPISLNPQPLPLQPGGNLSLSGDGGGASVVPEANTGLLWLSGLLWLACRRTSSRSSQPELRQSSLESALNHAG